MRRASALLVIPLLAAAAAVAGCGSSSPKSSASSTSSAPSHANQQVTATGAFGASPKVVVPKAVPGPDLFSKTVIQGSGKALTTSDALIGNFVLYDWSGTTHKLIGSTFSGNGPTLFSTDQMLDGLKSALIGQKVGSRVVAVLPPKYAFGTTGNSQIGVKGTDTLVYVVDLDSTVGNTQGASGATVSSGGGSLPTVTQATGKAPVVKVPKAAAPKALVVKPLVKGSGAAVVKGDYVVVQYTGVIWKSGKVFDSSWSRSSPFAFSIGSGQVVKGWDQGLVGQKVGSRVMLVLPPAYGYGSSGASQAGITGTDTLVFVVDVLGTFKPTK
jgi:FKBP-type peptidyl-prolyl cis-trans isomerase